MPHPPTTGATHRVLNVGRQLKKCGQVTVLYIGKVPSNESLDATRDEFSDCIVLEPCVPRSSNPKTLSLTTLRRALTLRCPGRGSPAQEAIFAQLRKKHDLLWFNTLRTADYFSCYPAHQSVVDMDDLNQLKYQLKSKHSTNFAEKLSDRISMLKWRWRERQAVKRFSLVTVCSAADKACLRNHTRVRVVPNGFTHPGKQPTRPKPEQTYLGFIGHLKYAPNRDGLKWFGDQIWPLITKELPKARLRIVGQLPKNSAFLDYPGFELLGFLEDPAEEFARWSAMVVPLRHGGGTRIKILEAFSKNCPVISTPLGAYGLEVKNGQHLLLAAKPQRFAQSCSRLLRDSDYGERLAEAAWSLFERKYTWDIIGQAINRVLLDCAATTLSK